MSATPSEQIARSIEKTNRAAAETALNQAYQLPGIAERATGPPKPKTSMPTQPATVTKATTMIKSHPSIRTTLHGLCLYHQAEVTRLIPSANGRVDTTDPMDRWMNEEVSGIQFLAVGGTTTGHACSC